MMLKIQGLSQRSRVPSNSHKLRGHQMILLLTAGAIAILRNCACESDQRCISNENRDNQVQQQQQQMQHGCYYLHVIEPATLAGVHGTTHVQHQQRGIACQEANGPGGAGRSIGWGLKGRMIKDWQRVKGKRLPWWQRLLVGLNKLWCRPLQSRAGCQLHCKIRICNTGYVLQMRTVQVIGSHAHAQQTPHITSALCCNAQARWFGL